MLPQGSLDRDERVRAALYRARLLANRTPHLSPATRREANRALDILDGQMGLTRVHVPEAARGIELLNRAHPSLVFTLLQDAGFVARFAAALRHLGLRGIEDRLDEVPASVMAQPIPGPLHRLHRDELPPDARFDAEGNPLPPPPGYY